MAKILLDTNIILDMALGRHPFFEKALNLVLLASEQDVPLFVTATTITDIYYIIRKSKGREAALGFVVQLLDIVQVAGVDRKVIEKALALQDLKDFEDAVQASTAILHEIDVLVTRNSNDFAGAPLQIFSPEEAISFLQAIA